MEQLVLIESSTKTKLESLDKEELIRRYGILEDELTRLIRENYQLRNCEISNLQIGFVLNQQLEELRHKIYGASSEKYKNPSEPKEDKKESPLPKKPRVQKPSERYPNLPVVVKIISQDPPPACGACGDVMRDSGLTDDSEQLTVIPKRYEVHVIKKVIYGCACHGHFQTTPAPERIKEGSVYSDDMILDVGLSKFLDLIPIERQAAMARRVGLIDIPPHSLIECTHYLAEFVKGVYLNLKAEILLSLVLNADETPHRMLEGDEKKLWHLWGFSTSKVCYFECHNTRSGDVASDILLKSGCEFLVSDVYSGYGKAVRVANEIRAKEGLKIILNCYCNVHSRRYFFKSFNDGNGEKEAEYFLVRYQKIYELNDACKGKSLPDVYEIRTQMRPYFEAMRTTAAESLQRYSEKSKFYQAMNYFLENYEGLTVCLTRPEVPLDNNSQERAFRSHVVGRKTWYGTHSKKGAETAAILFSIIETCKLNGVNPREYFKKLTSDMLTGYPAYTPNEYKTALAKEAKLI